MSVQLGNHYWTGGAVPVLDVVAASAADPRLAARLLGAVDALYASGGQVRPPYARVVHDAAHARLREELGEEFSVLVAEGEVLSVGDAAAYARRGRGPRGRPSRGWDSLTPADRQVVDCVAQGLSNPQIGERLFVSRKTVTSHLTHVFAKLQVSSRAELSAEAARRGM
jgi:DNA-binding CsgD family transcriptional regulator